MSLINLSEGSYLAIHSLVIIAEEYPERINVKQISEKLGASRDHLAKIFQKLSKDGIVSSVRGPNGGFVLDKSPSEITFLDIYEIIEGRIEKSACPFGKKKCPFDKCIFKNKLNKISEVLYNTLKEIKLSDF